MICWSQSLLHPCCNVTCSMECNLEHPPNGAMTVTTSTMVSTWSGRRSMHRRRQSPSPSSRYNVACGNRPSLGCPRAPALLPPPRPYYAITSMPNLLGDLGPSVTARRARQTVTSSSSFFAEDSRKDPGASSSPRSQAAIRRWASTISCPSNIYRHFGRVVKASAC